MRGGDKDSAGRCSIVRTTASLRDKNFFGWLYGVLGSNVP